MRACMRASVPTGATPSPRSAARVPARHGGGPGTQGWRGLNNPWIAEGEEHEEYQYINLLVNPERYTGYKVRVAPDGPSTTGVGVRELER